MRKPFHWTARNAWYVRQPTSDGKLKTIFLADDETEAMRIWHETFQPQRREFNPSSLEGVVIKQESTKPPKVTTGQKAMFADEWREDEGRKAKQAKLATLKNSSVDVVGLPHREEGKSLTETFPEASKGEARDKIGEKVGISGKSVDKARTIKETVPEVAKQVLAGEVTLAPPRSPQPTREPVESRLMQVARVLLLAELLHPLRRGATIRDLAVDVGEMLGQRFCKRTIQRDVMLLESLGVVAVEQSSETSCRQHPALRAYWIGGSIRSAIIQRMAEHSGEKFSSD